MTCSHVGYIKSVLDVEVFSVLKWLTMPDPELFPQDKTWNFLKVLAAGPLYKCSLLQNECQCSNVYIF